MFSGVVVSLFCFFSYFLYMGVMSNFCFNVCQLLVYLSFVLEVRNQWKTCLSNHFLGGNYYGTVPSCFTCNVQSSLSCDQCTFVDEQVQSGTHVYRNRYQLPQIFYDFSLQFLNGPKFSMTNKVTHEPQGKESACVMCGKYTNNLIGSWCLIQFWGKF